MKIEFFNRLHISHMSRTNIAIFGADAAAFHIFNMIYSSDDRYDVQFFLNIEDQLLTGSNSVKYPCISNSSLYPNGIPIISYSTNLLSILTERLVIL